jgi:hypothetical protein
MGKIILFFNKMEFTFYLKKSIYASHIIKYGKKYRSTVSRVHYTSVVSLLFLKIKYEIPYGIKSKKSNVVIEEEDLEIGPELEKVEEQVTVSAK